MLEGKEGGEVLKINKNGGIRKKEEEF